MSFSLNSIILSASCVLTGGALLLLDEERDASFVPACGSASDSEPLAIVDEASDAIGAYILAGDDRVQIVDLVWGVTKDNTIGIAVFKGMGEHGTVYDYERPEAYQRIAFSTDELRGCYMMAENGQRFVVDEIRFAIRADGLLAPYSMTGTSWTGAAFAYVSQGLCCGAVSFTSCVPAEECDVSCPGPINCQCSGTGSCELIMGTKCKGACGGGCPGVSTQQCRQTAIGPPMICECLQ